MQERKGQEDFWLLCRVHANPVAAVFSFEIMISFPYLVNTQQWTIIDKSQVIIASPDKAFSVETNLFLPAYVIVQPMEVRTKTLLVRLRDIDARTLNIEMPEILIFFGTREEADNNLQFISPCKTLGMLESVESNEECIDMQRGMLIEKK